MYSSWESPVPNLFSSSSLSVSPICLLFIRRSKGVPREYLLSLLGTCPLFARYLSATCSVLNQTNTAQVMHEYRTKSVANRYLFLGLLLPARARLCRLAHPRTCSLAKARIAETLLIPCKLAAHVLEAVVDIEYAVIQTTCIVRTHDIIKDFLPSSAVTEIHHLRIEQGMDLRQ